MDSHLHCLKINLLTRLIVSKGLYDNMVYFLSFYFI